MQWHNANSYTTIIRPAMIVIPTSYYRLLPSAKQATVQKQMSSSTLEQFKHLFVASVVGMIRWRARCAGTGLLLNVRGLS